MNLSPHSPLHEASKMGHKEVVEVLLNAKANVEERNTDGMTPLQSAVKSSHVPVVRLLLQFGADPQARISGDGKTSLELATNDELRSLLASTQPLRQEASKVENKAETSKQVVEEVKQASEKAPLQKQPSDLEKVLPTKQTMSPSVTSPVQMASSFTGSSSDRLVALLEEQMFEIRLLRKEIEELKQIVSSVTAVPGNLSVQLGGKIVTYKCDAIGPT
jgi:hypothetical protein